MFKKCTAVFLAILFILSLSACADQTPVYEKNGFAMGSAINIRIYGSENASQIAQEVLTLINETDALLSANIETSDISKINNSPSGATVSKDTFDLLGDCLSVCNTTGKVLDITVGAVTELWGFDTQSPTLPQSTALQAALDTVDADLLLLDEENLIVAKSEGQRIDLGAFGKGIACMRGLEGLRSELSPAIVSIGGTVLLYGNHPDAEHWSVGIRDPHGTANDYCATLALTVKENDDTLVISTSGSYEKTFSQNGETYHHILDKQTGMPVNNGILSVTVVAEGGLVSDALSTVLFIHGLSKQTLQVLTDYRVEAVFLCADGRCLVSNGLTDKIKLTDSNWTLGDLEETIEGAQ